MPLFEITTGSGLDAGQKEGIRADICRDMGLAAGIDSSFVAVLFKCLPENDMSRHGSFTEVYISEGRSAEFKERLAGFVAADICRHTGWEPSAANVLIHDLAHGSVAVNGAVVNRTGTAAETVIKQRDCGKDGDPCGENRS